MFTFEDLSQLDGAGLQTLLRAVEKDKLAVALKGASEKLREMFFKNMSERAAKILRDDMEAWARSGCATSRRRSSIVVNMAKDLAAQGEIVIADGKDEEMVY